MVFNFRQFKPETERLSLQARLQRCRNVLGGKDENGNPGNVTMFDEDLISFAHGEGIRRPHPDVIAAGVRAILDTEESSLDNYLFLQRLEPLDRRIAELFESEGVPADIAKNICIDSGTTKIFIAYLNAVAQPGDIFLVAPTFYHSLVGWCDIHKLQLEVVPTDATTEFKLTAEHLQEWYRVNGYEKGGVRPRGLFLFNPTQTGAIYNKAELESLAAFCVENDLLVLEDAIFMGSEFDENAPKFHIAGCSGMAERALTVFGGSKVHNLANIRIGWACGPKSLIDKMNTFVVATSATTPHIMKAMALAALNAPDQFVRANANECKERVQLIMKLIDKANKLIAKALPAGSLVPTIGIPHEPKAGHSILLDFNKMRGYRTPAGATIKDSVDVVRYFMNEAKVAFSPGFASGFDGCELRMSFGCVGLEATYAVSKKAEILAAMEAVLDQATNHSDLNLAPLPAGQSSAAVFQNDQNAGFEAGRAAIETAIFHRLVPAIIKIARANLNYVPVPSNRVRGRVLATVVKLTAHKKAQIRRRKKSMMSEHVVIETGADKK